MFLTVGAGLFLAGWWAHDIRRRRRRRAHPGAPGAVFAAGDPRHRSELRAVSDAVGAAGQRSTSLLRSSAIVGLGTALSRITGFLRVAAIAYAIGAGAWRGRTATPTRPPTCSTSCCSGVLTATLVPQFVRHVEREDDEAISAIMTIAIAGARGGVRGGRAAGPVHRPGVHPSGRGCEQGCAAGGRDDPGAPVHAPDRLLRVHRARDCAAERASPIRGGCVRADAQQHRGHLDLCLAAPLARRADHARPRPRRHRVAHHVRRGNYGRHRGRCARARRGLAMGPDPAPVRVRVAASRRRRDGPPLVVDPRLRDGEPDRPLDRARPGQRPRRRAVHLPQARTRSSSSPTGCWRSRS